MASRQIENPALWCMEASAVGDAIGYKSGKWEFEFDSAKINREAVALGGVLNFVLDRKNWPVSDDTVMHMATALAIAATICPDKGLRKFIADQLKTNQSFYTTLENCADVLDGWTRERRVNRVFKSSSRIKLNDSFQHNVTSAYVACLSIMEGRAPGKQTIAAVDHIQKNGSLPSFSETAGGNGAAMRTMCIGLIRNAKLGQIVDWSVIASTVTHPNPTAIFGGCMSAVFTNLALKGVAIESWPSVFFGRPYAICESQIRHIYNLQDKDVPGMDFFKSKWTAYFNARFKLVVKTGASFAKKVPTFPDNWETDYVARDAFYQQFAYVHPKTKVSWIASSGHDALIVAYDALLFAGKNFVTLMNVAALHGGDNDSTAAISGAFYGAMYDGLYSVNHQKYVSIPYSFIKGLEFKSQLYAIGGFLNNVVMSD